MAGRKKDEYAVIVGSFIQGADGHNVPRLLAYPMNKEMVSDPVFVEFAQAACPFMVPGIYPRDYDAAIKTAYKMKESGNKAFHNGEYVTASTRYRYALQLFEFVLPNFSHFLNEIVVLNSNLSGTFFKLEDYEKALEHAANCIDLDQYFLKGYYRRAEAYRGLAQKLKADGHDPTTRYHDALRDYCRCYRKMSTEKERFTRLKQFCEALMIAIDLNATSLLPDFHKEDKDVICGQIISHIVSNYPADKVKAAINFLLFINPDVPKSGLATKHSCNLSETSVILLYSKGIILTEELLDKFIDCKLQVKTTDLVKLASEMKEEHLPLFVKILSVCKSQCSKKFSLSLRDIVDKSLLAKPSFAVCLFEEGATPTRDASSLAFEFLLKKPQTYERVVIKCLPHVRAEFAAKCLTAGDEDLLKVTLESGPINSDLIDLSLIMCSKILDTNVSYVSKLIRTGASPDGVGGSTPPLKAVFKASALSRDSQVKVACILIGNEADIKNLSSAFHDPMSPVHAATKLALETGNFEVLQLTCCRFEFPANGRLVDRHNRTPLHIVMLSEPTPFNIRVLEHLVEFNIDKTVKDDQGKRAEEYVLPENDKERKTLVSVPFRNLDRKSKGKGGGKGLKRGEEDMFDENDFDMDKVMEWESRLDKMSRSERMPKLMRMYLGRKAGPWGCDSSIFPHCTTFEEAVSAARAQKEEAHALFNEKKYTEALTIYGKSHMKYDWICANFPRKIPFVKDDIKRLVCSMALGYQRSEVPEASVECANDAIDIDPNYSKAYYRRAEAYKMIATLRKHPNNPNHPHDCFCKAVRDYSKAYVHSTTPSEIDKRSVILSECIILAVNIGETHHVPKIHKYDEQHILTKVIEILTGHEMSYYTKDFSIYLSFILLKTTSLSKSGLAHSYPCSCSTVSINVLLPDIQMELLKALLSRDCIVVSTDIIESIKCMKKSQLPLLKLMITSYDKNRKRTDASMTQICQEIMDTKKLHFISLLISHGATPPAHNILEFADFSKLDSVLARYIAKYCSSVERTKLISTILEVGGNIEVLEYALTTGPISPENINLPKIVSCNLILAYPTFLRKLLEAGLASSQDCLTTTSAMEVLYRSKTPTRLQLAQISDILIKHGANLESLSAAYSEPLTPIHIATKLSIETGYTELVDTVCSRYQFSGRTKLVDKNNQTPFHYALRAKNTEKTTKVCEILSNYPIDPMIKDRWGKLAQEYIKSKGDKRIGYLRKAGQLVSNLTVDRDSTSNNSKSVTEKNTEHQKGKRKKKKKCKVVEEKQAVERNELMIENDEDNMIESDSVTIQSEASTTTLTDTAAVDTELIDSNTSPDLPDLHTLLVYISQRERQYFYSTTFSESTAYDKHNSHDTLPDSPNVNLAFFEHSVDAETTKLISEQTDFDKLPWEVEITDKLLRLLKDPRYPDHFKFAIIHKVYTLALGAWSDDSAHVVTRSDEQAIYTTQTTPSTCIVWEIAVQFSSRCTDKDIVRKKGVSLCSRSHVYSEVIRIWDVAVVDGNGITSCVDRITESRRRGSHAHVNISLLPHHDVSIEEKKGSNDVLPRRFLLHSSDNHAHEDSRYKGAEPLKYVPAASVKEDEFHVVTFYTLSTLMVHALLEQTDPRRDFPFKEWPKEHDIICIAPDSEAILLLGRSGTGKTTCCLYRLWNHFLNYWEQAKIIGCWHAHRPLPLLVGVSGENLDSGSEMSQVLSSPSSSKVMLEDLHQVFLTKNYVLCAQMKKRFYDMAASHDHLANHMTYENTPLPTTLSKVHNKAYPLFLTSRQFLIILDSSLDKNNTFFPHYKDGSLAVRITSSDYDHENPDTLLDLEETDSEDELNNEEEPGEVLEQLNNIVIIKQSTHLWREVTASYFVNEIWPKIKHHSSDKTIDPLLVWMEIKSFIKGSLAAVQSEHGYLSAKEYEALGRKMAVNFTTNRSEIYELFERYHDYKHRKRNLNLFDEMDLVHHLYQKLIKINIDLPWVIHHFYIDEVQDFTQAELNLLLHISREPNGLFLTGDTAQSIMRGISFRFEDLRSLFHSANKISLNTSTSIPIPVPQVHELLINFRSHSGILQLAASIIELLKEYFPNSFDRLPEDQGMFPGPSPVFLQSCQVSDLALLMKSNKRTSSSIEFGAHQVVIVQNDEAKKNLPEVLCAGIVLTVFEAKGLEFDDVLLYNFFSDSPIEKEWRVVTNYANKTTPPSNETSQQSRPRPLEFDTRLHKSLNSELKYLYTAVTRAKCNLWIYDSSETRRLPMFDYWVRRGLVRVVRVGERDDDDSVLFTATSTPKQWSQQGNYFFKKGLWEPAVKCYQKSGNVLLEREAEGYLYAQRARNARVVSEVLQYSEKAALSFLRCDHVSHDVKYLVNAAKCLKNARKYCESAGLFEKLGQKEIARRCYYRARDYSNISRLLESDGDFSGAVRVFVRSNKRFEALKLAHRYETEEGRQLDSDVGTVQLANLYAKHYIAHHDLDQLKKTLCYIPNIALRVSHLKKGKLFGLAIEEYLQHGYLKEAERIMVAQGMFDKGLEVARSLKNTTMETNFVFLKALSVISRKDEVDQDLDETLKNLTKSNGEKPSLTQARALLLYGMIEEDSSLCSEAVKIYSDKNTVGALEALDQCISFKHDVAFPMVVSKCFDARDLAKSFNSTIKTPKRTQHIQQALEFYKFIKLDNVYLVSPHSCDVWIKNLKSTLKKEQEYDENGMMRLDSSKVHVLLGERFTDFSNRWLVDTDLEKRMLTRLSSYTFHKDIIDKGYLTRHLLGYPLNNVKDYIQTVLLALQAKHLSSKMFKGQGFENIPVRLFDPLVSLCLPLVKTNRIQLCKSEAVSQILTKTFHGLTTSSCLRKPNVDDLFKAWICQSLDSNIAQNRFEELLENFAMKEGPGDTHQQNKTWLIVDRVYKKIEYRHFFVFWLKACRLVREKCEVIGAAKLLCNCFFTTIARRSSLRKTISVINFVFPVTIITTALLGIISIADPKTSVAVPIFFRYFCQLFDDVNIQEGQQYWLLSACVVQMEKQQDSNELISDLTSLLSKLLQILLGSYCNFFNALKSGLASDETNTLVHCLVLVFVLIGNLIILRPQDHEQLYASLLEIKELIGIQLRGQSSTNPSYLQQLFDKLSSIKTVSDLFGVVQYLLNSGNFPTNIAKLQNAKSGNMEFKELSSLPNKLGNIKLNPRSSPTPPPSQESQSSNEHTSTKEEVPVSSKEQEDAPVNSQVQLDQQQQLPPATVYLQEQWTFVMQRLEELQQYLSIVQQHLNQLQAVPRHLLTQPQEQQQTFLTQQFYQLLQTQQQYRLQQEHIQQQYQLALLQNATNSTVPTSSAVQFATGSIATESEPELFPKDQGLDESGASKLEEDADEMMFDEEIERILGSFMSGPPPPSLNESANGSDQPTVNMNNSDSELIDKHYCQVCGVSFQKEYLNFDEFEDQQEVGGVKYRDHINLQSHLENMMAYKNYNATKTQEYEKMRNELNEVIAYGKSFNAVAEIDSLMLQINTDLQEIDERLEEFVSTFNWREAYSCLCESLDIFQSCILRLTYTCDKARVTKPSKPVSFDILMENEAEVVDEEEEIEMAETFESTTVSKEKSRNKKRQKKFK